MAESRHQLAFLDGLRGIASLWVLVGHAMFLTGYKLVILAEPDIVRDQAVIVDRCDVHGVVLSLSNALPLHGHARATGSGPVVNLTRASIVLRKRWIAGSSPAMTKTCHSGAPRSGEPGIQTRTRKKRSLYLDSGSGPCGTVPE